MPHQTPQQPADEQVQAQWARIRGRLQSEVGETTYRSWLRSMTLGAINGTEAVVLLPTEFQRSWVEREYGDRITALWKLESGLVRSVEFRAGPMGTPPVAEPMPCLEEPIVAAGPEFGAPADMAVSSSDRLAPISGALDGRFVFDSFVIGKPNEFAHACARKVADTPGLPAFNPLFLYGGVGLGKTHLMQAIALELIRNGRPGTRVAYMSGEKFMYGFIQAIRANTTMEFKDQLRTVDVLLIDDVQFMAGKDNTQEEFFHTFNALVEAGRQIVVSADKSPSELAGFEARLRTRLGCGMVADLHATTFELRISILEAKSAVAGIHVPPRVLEFLAHKIPSNIRELVGCLNRLLAHASIVGRAITLDSTQEVLRDVLASHDRRVSIEEIQKRVAEHFGMRLTDMTSARRSRNVARPRQVAMWLCKQLTERSLPEIGRMFGNRDHTTVMHGVAKVTELMAQDPLFREQVELLESLLKR